MVGLIKITYIIDQFIGRLGGTENQLLKLIRGLDKNKFQVQLVSLDGTDWLQKNASLFECECKMLSINRTDKLSTYVNYFKLIKYLQTYKADVVHTFFPLSNSLCVMAAKVAGVKNIVSSRRDYGEWMNNKYLIATRLANLAVKKIVVNAQSVKDLTKMMEKVSDDKIQVILNGIDTSLYQSVHQDYDLKKVLQIPDRNKVIGIIANFREMKHHHIFIQAAHKMLKTRQDISFILIGGGSRESHIKALAESLKIANNVWFCGQQEDVIPYLSIMDVGINCSKREGLSNAVMEYMATGVPCVVSDAGGNTDLITHDVNGYVFALDDYQTLAHLSLKLLADAQTRGKFIAKAREKIEQEMSMEKMIGKYETLYENLVAK